MTKKNRATDASFLRGVTQRGISRRDILRISGLSAATIAFAAACGVKGQGTPTATGTDAVKAFWDGKTKHGKLSFANWPLYMDTDKKPELTKFTEQTGIQVSYDEVIQEMGPWFAKVQPQLAAGQSIGYDLMVITNGIQFKQFKQLGYLAPLDHAQMPNFTKNVGASYTHSTYDPGNAFSVPWASGMTGIAYDPEKVGEITKLADLWDPQYAGKVGMFSDTQELANFGLLVLGLDPDTSTPADWDKAAKKLKDQKDAGIVRNYYDQSYIDALASGEVWITQAWSGDILQRNLSDGSNLQFIIPEEGGTIWTDNMAIPSTAENPVDALMLLDFFYDPAIAASLAEYIGYVTPVPSAKAAMQADADAAPDDDTKSYIEDLIANPTIFPDDGTYQKLHYYVDFETTELQQQFQSTFEPIVLS